MVFSFDKSILKQALEPLTICIAGFCLQFTLSILLTKTLSTAQFGLINYTIFISILLSSLIAGGTNANSKYFSSTYLRHNDFKDLTQYIAWNIQFVKKPVSISLICFTIIFLFVDPFELYFSHNLTDTTKILTVLFFAAPLHAISSILNAYLLSDEKVKLSTYFSYIQINTLMIIFILLGLYTHRASDRLDFILWVFLLVSILHVFICFITIKLTSPRIYQCFHPNNHIKLTHNNTSLWNKSALIQLMGNFGSIIMLKIDYFILVFFMSSHVALGIYGVAINTAIFLTFIPMGVFQHLVPEVSTLLENKSKTRTFQTKWNQCLALNNFILLIFSMLMLFFTKTIILTFFGQEYLAAAPILKILAVTYTLTSISGLNHILLALTGHAQYCSISYCLRIVLCLILAFCFQNHGLIGIAYASFISELIRNIYVIIVIKKKVHLKPLGIV